MRKLDVLLLSALILYDYGAQTLVDRDIISMGNTVITSAGSFLEMDQDEYQVATEANEFAVPENTGSIAGATAPDATRVKNIHYYELAKVKSVGLTSEETLENKLTAVYISVPDYAAEAEMTAPGEAETEAVAMENTAAFALATVNTATDVSVSDLSRLEVISETDEGKLQFADSDGDGLFNYEDQCPGIAGVARFEGCPVPDSDGDGINDEEDHCPLIVGAASNQGCPVEEDVENNADSVDFANDQTGSIDNSSVMQFELMGNGALSNHDFNVLLQLADEIINNNAARIVVERSGNNSVEAQTNTVITYLQQLGVRDHQISMVSKNKGSGGQLQVQLRY